MKNIRKKILAIILSAIVAFSMPTALAVDAYYNLPLDAGNHHRFSGGGSHRSSRSRSRSRSHTTTGGSSSGDNLDDVGTIILCASIFIIFISLVIYFVKSPSTSSRKAKTYKNIPPMFPYNATEQITEFIKQNDENFDTEKFLSWAKKVFIALQAAWTERDWEKIRTLEKEELFEQHNIQLQEFIRLGRINVMDNIQIIDAYLHKFGIDENYEHLIVSLRATMNDYIIDEKSGKVIAGDKYEVFDTIYQMTFTRRKGIKTNIVKGRIVSICPHCGAEVESSSAGKCQYCGSVIHSGEFNWVLSNLESVDENFVDDTRGVVFINN